MKSINKILAFLISIILIASCSSNSKKQEEEEASLQQADSIGAVEAENARKESLRQDSIKRAEMERYDQMISECEYLANKYNKAVKKYQNFINGSEEEDPGDPNIDYEKFRNKYQQIILIIDNLSPEQFKRVETIEKTTISPIGILWG